MLGLSGRAAVLHRWRTAAVFAVLAGLSLRFFLALWVEFLYPWDEQYHFLVAKNLVEHPLPEHPWVPTLFPETPLPYDYRDWARNHVWLHKPPLYLWQMALSFKVFGFSLLAGRLPSILLGSLTVWLLFLIGRRLWNPATGYWMALLWAFNGFQVMLVAGATGLDHNDVATVFYLTAALWAWTRYRDNPSWKWALGIGGFTALAILCKWVIAASPLVLWGLWWLLQRPRYPLWHQLFAGGLAVLPYGIWLLYTYQAFPAEAAHELGQYFRHLETPLENHYGGSLYYLITLPYLYGWLAPALGLIGLRELWQHSSRVLGGAICATVVVHYLVFSVAPTKAVQFPLVVAPLVVAGLALVLQRLSQLQSPFAMLLVVLVLIANATPRELYRNLSGEQAQRRTGWAEAAQAAAPLVANSKWVVLGVPKEYAPMGQWYSGALHYALPPTHERLRHLHKQGYQVAAPQFSPGPADKFLALPMLGKMSPAP